MRRPGPKPWDPLPRAEAPEKPEAAQEPKESVNRRWD